MLGIVLSSHRAAEKFPHRCFPTCPHFSSITRHPFLYQSTLFCFRKLLFLRVVFSSNKWSIDFYANSWFRERDWKSRAENCKIGRKLFYLSIVTRSNYALWISFDNIYFRVIWHIFLSGWVLRCRSTCLFSRCLASNGNANAIMKLISL